PYSGDWTFYGGLYRNVWLVSTEEVHLDVLDHGSPGVFVDTPQVDASRAVVRVRGRVVNDSEETAEAAVRAGVTERGGKAVVAEAAASLRVAPGDAAEVELELPEIVEPRLWSPEDPALYTVATVVDSGRGRRDRVDSPLGIRWFSADPDQGFFLNGEPYPL